jgi:hypothetical protein
MTKLILFPQKSTLITKTLNKTKQQQQQQQQKPNKGTGISDHRP